MRYAIALLAPAAALAVVAVRLGGAGLALLWPAASLLAVAVAYAGVGARVFGKRADGTRAAGRRLLLLPYLALVLAVWHVWRLAHGEPAHAELRPGLRFGRRLRPREVPPDAALVVDLTGELPRSVPPGVRYWCLPVLDAHVPREAELRALIGEIEREPGGVYVHCANGRGRAALVAAALLLATGDVSDPDDAIDRVRRLRPETRLRAIQRSFLARWVVGGVRRGPTITR